MKIKFNNVFKKLKNSFSRFPFVIVSSLLAAVFAVILVSNTNESTFLYGKLTLTFCLGISTFFALQIDDQANKKNRLLNPILGLGILIVFFIFLPYEESSFTEVHGYIVALSFLASHLLVSFLPFWKQNNRINFWNYNKNLFVCIILTGLFTFILGAGIALGILAIDKLFDLNLDNLLYPRTIVFILIFGSVSIFLLFVEDGISSLEKETPYPKFLKFLTQFILIPLLFIYLLILYVYGFKILINWELPRGWVSYLIIIYSTIGILVNLLIYPLKNEDSKHWINTFSTLFYYSVIPLLFLLFTAIYTRVLEYGFTEPRYFVLIISYWVLFIVLCSIFYKNFSLKTIPISLFACVVLSLIFPYFNAFSVSKRSQKKELINLLENEKIVKNGTIDFSKKISNSKAEEIADKISFLHLRNEDDYIKSLFDTNVQIKLKSSLKNKNKDLYYQILNTFSYKTNSDTENNLFLIQLISTENYRNIKGYEYEIDFMNLSNKGLKIGNDYLILENAIHTQTNSLHLTLNTNTKIDLRPLIESYALQHKKGTTTLKEVFIEFKIDNYKIKVLFENLTLSKPINKLHKIYFDNAVFLIKTL